MPSPVNFGGLASGLDTKALVDAIMSVERQPLERLQSKVQEYSARKSAYGELQSKLTGFESALRDLSSASTFRARNTTVSDATVFRATPGTDAEVGLFTIEVTSLAQADKIKSDGLAASDQGLVNDGTLTIQSGANNLITVDVSAAEGNNTLEAVRDAINGADAGVQAAIIYDGTSYRLSVRSEATGLDNALTITDGTNLNLTDAANRVQTATDAALKVDGIDVVSSSNKVTGVIPGVTLDLLDTNQGSPATLEIDQDIDKVVEGVQSLVGKYNEIVDFFNTQFSQESPGPLSGDGTAIRIQARIQSIVTGGVPGIPLGDLRSLSSVGADFDGKTGKITLDTTTLRDLLESNFDDVGNLFLASGSATDPKVSYVGGTTATVSGEYAVTLSQAAEQATVAGGTAFTGSLGQNETLTIALGSSSVDVNLTAGQTLSQAVDTINSALRDADISATARDDGGFLRITTGQYGSAADISVTSSLPDPGDGTQTGFTTTAATDTGVDVAGTIGGVAAVGVGQVLTGAEGGDYEGLALRARASAADITAQAGDFGTISYSRGLMKTLISEVDDLTRFDSGPIDLARESLTSNIKRYNKDIDDLNERLSVRETQLIRTFTKAEQAISALQAQQNAFGAFG